MKVKIGIVLIVLLLFSINIMIFTHNQYARLIERRKEELIEASRKKDEPIEKAYNAEVPFIYDRQDRIDEYMLENPNLSKEECIKRVYMNLDYEPYETVSINDDLDSLTMLVNKYNGLPEDYVPADLVEVVGGQLVRQPTADAFNELVNACASFGLSLSAWSAFRSYEYQYDLYNNGVNNYGLEYAEAYWTHPGFSEHQTGLTIDVCLDGNRSDLDAARHNVHYQEFLETLHEYGFILRYPDDKEEYTLIAPESWHIRYVGVTLATYLYENNLCLDEYYGLKEAKMINSIQ